MSLFVLFVARGVFYGKRGSTALSCFMCGALVRDHVLGVFVCRRGGHYLERVGRRAEALAAKKDAEGKYWVAR